MSVSNSAHLPLLSILIPTYNRPGYLDECLYSILGQDFEDYEIIAKDNHSDDVEGYARVIEKYQKVFTNKGVVLRYVRNDKNLGVVGNKHEGVVKDCKGKYCIIVDDDDFYTSNKVLSLYVRMFQTIDDVAVVTGEVRRFYQDTESPPVKKIIDENAHRLISGSPLIVDGNEYFLGFWNRFGTRQCNVTMFDRQLALDRGWPYVECNDQSILLLLAPGNKVVIFDDQLAYYRIHASEHQKPNESKTVTPQQMFESHTAILDWVDNTRKNTNISSLSLFIWRLKNIILKERGFMIFLHSRNEDEMREFCELLRNYSKLDYYVQRYLDPNVIKWDYDKANNCENRFIRFLLKVMIGIRWATSNLILQTDRILHDPEYRYKCRIDRLFYDPEYRFRLKRKISRLILGSGGRVIT